jgi:hypothetical protein
MIELLLSLGAVWLATLLLIAAVAALMTVWDSWNRPISPKHQFRCPLCSREMHADWFTDRGCCCDCDEELGAIGRAAPRLTMLNPHILHPVSPEWNNSNHVPHSTHAAACAGRHAALGSNVS